MKQSILCIITLCASCAPLLAQDMNAMRAIATVKTDIYTTMIDTSLIGYYIDFTADDYVNGVLLQSKDLIQPYKYRNLPKEHHYDSIPRVDSSRRQLTFFWNDQRLEGAGTIIINEKFSSGGYSYDYRIDTNVWDDCATFVFDSAVHPGNGAPTPVTAHCFARKGVQLPPFFPKTRITDLIRMYPKVVLINWEKKAIPVDDGNDITNSTSIKKFIMNETMSWMSLGYPKSLARLKMMDFISEEYDNGVLIGTKDVKKLIAQNTSESLFTMTLPVQDSMMWDISGSWDINKNGTCSYSLDHGEKHCFTLYFTLDTFHLDSCGILYPKRSTAKSMESDRIPFSILCIARKNEPLMPCSDTETVENIVKKYAHAVVIYYRLDTTNIMKTNDMMNVDAPDSVLYQYISLRLPPTKKPSHVNFIIEVYDNTTLKETIDGVKMNDKDKTHSPNLVPLLTDTVTKYMNIVWKGSGGSFAVDANGYVKSFYFDKDSSVVRETSKSEKYFHCPLDINDAHDYTNRGILHFVRPNPAKKNPVTACCFSRSGASFPSSLATDSVDDLIHRYAKTIVVYEEIEDGE